MCEEFVTEAVLSEDKMEVLVWDLLVIDTWKTRVWSKVPKEKIGTGNLLKVYFTVMSST